MLLIEVLLCDVYGMTEALGQIGTNLIEMIGLHFGIAGISASRNYETGRSVRCSRRSLEKGIMIPCSRFHTLHYKIWHAQ